MITPNSAGNAGQRIERALARIVEELPALANIVSAFRDLLIERARLKEEVSIDAGFSVPEIEPERLRQGAPVGGKDMFWVSGDDLKTAADRLIPAMERGLPRVAAELTSFMDALRKGTVDMTAASEHFLADRSDELETLARDWKTTPEMVGFVMAQLTKPFAEKQAESIGPLLDGLHWDKGYCPLCGSWPSLSFLKDKEGRRWLKCSFCSHEWRFVRTSCPFCDNMDHETMERFYSEDRTSEQVEVCHKCKRYVLSLDLRERAEETVLEVASLGLIYLDILAQGKGFSPGAVTEWNVIDGE